jgi:hypothetical protein
MNMVRVGLFVQCGSKRRPHDSCHSIEAIPWGRERNDSYTVDVFCLIVWNNECDLVSGLREASAFLLQDSHVMRRVNRGEVDYRAGFVILVPTAPGPVDGHTIPMLPIQETELSTDRVLRDPKHPVECGGTRQRLDLFRLITAPLLGVKRSSPE